MLNILLREISKELLPLMNEEKLTQEELEEASRDLSVQSINLLVQLKLIHAINGLADAVNSLQK